MLSWSFAWTSKTCLNFSLKNKEEERIKLTKSKRRLVVKSRASGAMEVGSLA